ncbi:MAG: hypothetical protein N3A01_06100 [Bacteroidales bacterium]|nr:hypothetical protein [Bacteroidales bacterium]
MKRFFILIIILSIITISFVKSQTLIAEFKTQPFVTELTNGSKTFECYLYGIESEKQAVNIENFIKGYRGVENFTITKENGLYKVHGTFYMYANNLYFKNLFKIMNINKIKHNNTFINIDEFNFLNK